MPPLPGREEPAREKVPLKLKGMPEAPAEASAPPPPPPAGKTTAPPFPADVIKGKKKKKDAKKDAPPPQAPQSPPGKEAKAAPKVEAKQASAPKKVAAPKPEAQPPKSKMPLIIALGLFVVLLLVGGIALVVMGIMGAMNEVAEEPPAATPVAEAPAPAPSAPPVLAPPEPSAPAATIQTPPPEPERVAETTPASMPTSAPPAQAVEASPEEISDPVMAEREAALIALVASLRSSDDFRRPVADATTEQVIEVSPASAPETAQPTEELTIGNEAPEPTAPEETAPEPVARPTRNPDIEMLIRGLDIKGVGRGRINIGGKVFEAGDTILEDPLILWMGQDAQLGLLMFKDASGYLYEIDL